MRRLQSLLLVAALLASGMVYAGPVSADRAATVARHFYESLPGIKGDIRLADRSAEWQYDGIYLFTNEGGGYVLVAADDAVRPILGYSASATLDPASLPQALHEWLAAYQRQIDALRALDAQGYAAGDAEWESLLTGSNTKDGHTPVVGPLLATLWDQQYPYNILCPANAVTGCAATAQAQLMKYWNHPAFGSGSYTYFHERYGTLSADFEHTLYDWDNMPAIVSAASSSAQINAVATLMFHCGVSINMSYGTVADGGSGAIGFIDEPGFTSCNNALRDYFHYSPDLHSINKFYGYTNDQWRQELIAELDLLHPILYMGQSSAGGHAFVCDGYDDRGYMHFNFGWSGNGDGYFPVDSISPGVGGVGGGSYTFNDLNAAIIGAVPVYDLQLSDTIVYFSRSGGSDSLLYSIDPTVNATLSVSCDAPWLNLTRNTANTAGWLHIDANANTSGADRSATITFTQGSRTRTVTVMQSIYDNADLCPLTVVMESTHGNGWEGGANLSFETAGGYVFGSVTLKVGNRDTVTVDVAPHDVYAVWHSGGGTDRYINYRILNQYGETLVNVVYAFSNGGTHLIEWPCVHVGIESPEAAAVAIYPNPTSGMLTIEADGLQRIELTDLAGRLVASGADSRLDISRLAPGTYILRVVTGDGISTHRIVKE